MSRENVVPFQRSSRGALARRGAPDKRQRSPETLELECPRCGTPLSLETDLASCAAEILCPGCDGSIRLRVADLADLG